MKSFSPFNPTKSPYKIALFKNLNLVPSFHSLKRLKRIFYQTSPKKESLKKKEFKRKSLKKKEFKRKSLKKKSLKKKSLKKKSLKKREFKRKALKKSLKKGVS